MATKHGYARKILGGGNALKAATRVKRTVAGRSIGRAPGREPGPAVYKRDLRALRKAMALMDEQLEDAA